MYWKVVITCIVLLISCNQVGEGNKIKQSSLIIKQDGHVENNKGKMVDLDSIIVKYWESTKANNYYFKYDGNTIIINSQYFSIGKKISSEKIIERFLGYIDVFFIAKSEMIEIERKVADDPISTDFSTISVEGYRNGNAVFKKGVKIGEESYEIKYNPRFTEFIEFLDKLITEKREG